MVFALNLTSLPGSWSCILNISECQGMGLV
uniref:Uncharacterized protein n=1 Tax=Anguilla anguilla TaxID=7936 RepID=A0A0E9V767_ANGAN